jgi:hypothetical protein
LVAGAVIAALVGATITYFLTRNSGKEKQVETADRLKGYVVENFSIESAGDGLVNTANGRPWSGSRKSFKVVDGQLMLADDGSKGAHFLLVDTGAPNQVVAATFPKVETGSGIVFRYKGPSYYWSLTAAKNAGTWTLTKVENGEKENPVLLGSAPTEDGTQVMVRTEGNRMFFYFDGVLYNTFNDGANAEATRAGFLFAGPDASKVRADEFVALPARQRIGGGTGGAGGGKGPSGSSGASGASNTTEPTTAKSTTAKSTTAKPKATTDGAGAGSSTAPSTTAK